MISRSFLLPLILLLLGTESCFTHWSDEQRQAFERQCSRVDTVERLSFLLTGFAFAEIDTILVRQLHQGDAEDSFWVHPDEHSYDPKRQRYTATIEQPVYRKDSYEFSVPGHSTFILSHMRQVMWAQYTMYSEDYGCVMGDYQLNGVRYEDNTTPDLVRHGFKFP